MVKTVFKGGHRHYGGEEESMLTNCSCGCPKCKTKDGLSGEVETTYQGKMRGSSHCECTCWCERGQANSQRRDDTSEVSAEAG